MERPETLRNTLRRMAAGLSLAAAGLAMPAHAQTAAPMLMPSMTAALGNVACAAPSNPVISLSDQGLRQAGISKASAILGGGTSALERMRAQQASIESLGSLLPQAGPSMQVATEPQYAPLEPASAAFAKVLPCASDFGAATTGLAATRRAPALAAGLGRDDFLSSRKVALGRTSFDAAWTRVSREKPRFGKIPAPLVADDTALDERLETVNRWVNHAITYTEDRVLFGKADHWAGARKTLQLGKGDCEDYALLKMHLLAAAGVRREDMFLTIARDLVRRADHAVLIVRTENGYRMLDNATDTVLDATLANDYQAVLSFNDRRTWLHGT